MDVSNIHDLKNILDRVELDNILSNLCDKRLSAIKELTVVQLREECLNMNLCKKGKKVYFMCLQNAKKLFLTFKYFTDSLVNKLTGGSGGTAGKEVGKR